MNVLVTGAAGYLGSLTVDALRDDEAIESVVALDVRIPEPESRLDGVTYVEEDVRSDAVFDLLDKHEIASVVHLAAIVDPGGMSDATQYSIDVLGTRNVLDACVAAGVAQVVVTSSGAAYGYHADNPRPLVETDALRGNDAFTYSRHKRLVEELLARYRDEHPDLGQLVLRPGTILGETVDNQITNLFDQPVVPVLAGVEAPFVLVWDRDVAAVIARGVREQRTGIYNVAGSGTLTLREMARRLGKPRLPLPETLTRAALATLSRLGLTRYGPEQVMFLRHRPVLDNAALRRDFPGLPRLTTKEVFDRYANARRERG